MDPRDIVFWQKQAAREKLIQRMQMLQAARVAWASDEYYSAEVSSIRQEIRKLDLGKEAVIKEGWEKLQSIGRM